MPYLDGPMSGKDISFFAFVMKNVRILKLTSRYLKSNSIKLFIIYMYCQAKCQAVIHCCQALHRSDHKYRQAKCRAVTH